MDEERVWKMGVVVGWFIDFKNKSPLAQDQKYRINQINDKRIEMVMWYKREDVILLMVLSTDD